MPKICSHILFTVFMTLMFSAVCVKSFAQSEDEGGDTLTTDWTAMADWLDFKNDSLEKRSFFSPSAGSSSTTSFRPWGADRYSRPFGSSARARSRQEHDPSCTHEKFSQSYNTPSRIPDRLPVGEVRGLSPQSRGPTASGPRSKRLADAAIAEASECRVTASHVRNRTGQSRLCGPSRSKGKCYAAVKDALVAAGITSSRLPGGSAYMAHSNGYLRQAGFVNRVSEYNRYNAPEGCVLVYAGGSHGHGHSEIKTSRGYCSDYCSANPLRSQNYRLTGVYCLPN